MTTYTTYKGWTNHETWLVHREIFDGWDDIVTPERLEEIANEIVAMGRPEHITTLALARSLVSNVNWHEIAEHLNENQEVA
tara:strand:+ start:408 stop:650 length:243 start_codon:yes stop_codon:yes gene_type:complete